MIDGDQPWSAHMSRITIVLTLASLLAALSGNAAGLRSVT